MILINTIVAKLTVDLLDITMTFDKHSVGFYIVKSSHGKFVAFKRNLLHLNSVAVGSLFRPQVYE